MEKNIALFHFCILFQNYCISVILRQTSSPPPAPPTFLHSCFQRHLVLTQQSRAEERIVREVLSRQKPHLTRCRATEREAVSRDSDDLCSHHHPGGEGGSVGHPLGRCVSVQSEGEAQERGLRVALEHTAVDCPPLPHERARCGGGGEDRHAHLLEGDEPADVVEEEDGAPPVHHTADHPPHHPPRRRLTVLREQLPRLQTQQAPLAREQETPFLRLHSKDPALHRRTLHGTLSWGDPPSGVQDVDGRTQPLYSALDGHDHPVLPHLIHAPLQYIPHRDVRVPHVALAEDGRLETNYDHAIHQIELHDSAGVASTDAVPPTHPAPLGPVQYQVGVCVPPQTRGEGEEEGRVVVDLDYLHICGGEGREEGGREERDRYLKDTIVCGYLI